MIDKKVQMMDAGMTLFTSAKPFGTVLGGIKTEMSGYGRVRRSNEISVEDIPDTTGECDLFMDWSTPWRWRAVSCKLEDAGAAGVNQDGEAVRRYAASFKEGNKNRGAKVAIVVALALLSVILGFVGIDGVPGIFTIIAGFVVSAFVLIIGLRPSRKAQLAVRNLMSVIAESK